MNRICRSVSIVFAVMALCSGLACKAQSRTTDFLHFPDTSLEFVGFDDLKGWTNDDHAAAFETFLTSCEAIRHSRRPRPARAALKTVCHAALSAPKLNDAKARAFFESHFRPAVISALGEPGGFLTGYYEPVIEGSRIRTDIYTTPVYRKPDDLVPLRGGGNKGPVGRRDDDGKILPVYYDRAEIDDGALEGRSLAICWIKDPVDLFFAQIQGSVKVHLTDGDMLRLNYSGHNGWPYSAVGRFLIEDKIVPREEMSLDRIRQYMHEHPDEGEKLRRRNRSYVFFRETGLPAEAGPVGAQGISLTAGRSIAVDKNLHVYGTPFFIEAALPLDSEKADDPFRRLMIAQDTGSAIVGPARADIYFGAGKILGSIAGRIKHPGRFAMLVPRNLDISDVIGDVHLPRVKPEYKPPVVTVSAETGAAGAGVDQNAAKPLDKSLPTVRLPRPRPPFERRK